jgi:hypothetical protein
MPAMNGLVNPPTLRLANATPRPAVPRFRASETRRERMVRRKTP